MAKDVLITPSSGSIEVKNDANALKITVVAETVTTANKTLTLPNKNGMIATTEDVPNITGGASSIVSSNLTASRALVSDTSGKVAVSAVTSTELGYLDGVTSAIQTQLGTTVKTSGNQTIAGTKTFSSTISGSINGNAGTATKLQTSRTINVGTGVSGTATSFNGSANIEIPINGVSEAYLTWGGKSIASSYAPIDAAMVGELGANRFAFMPADSITVQYSRDGGTSWIDYGATDSEKINLLNGIGTTFTVGKNSVTGIDYTNYRLRVIISVAIGGMTTLYTTLNKFVILVSTSGSSGTWCSIDGRTQQNLIDNIDTWTNFANQTTIGGWSGYNVINTSGITTYGNTPTTQYGQLRFTFGGTGSTNSGLQVMKLLGFGGVGWTTPSNLAKYGNMYTYDSSQNTLFPAAVQGTRLISTIATGTSPLAVTSKTLVSNLNSQYLNGQLGSYYTTAGNLSGTIPSAVLGNSTHYIGTTAVKLNRPSATLALTGVTNTNWDSAYTATNGATSANTASTIVKRGTSGEFSAGAISGTTLNVGTGSNTWTINDTTANVLTFKDGANTRLEIKAGGLYVNGSTTALGSGTVTSVTGTSPVVSSEGSTPAISLASGYGDTLNPYASKTAKFFLAAPNASAGVPTFRAIAVSDVPTLNQSTTGSAGRVANSLVLKIDTGTTEGTNLYTYNGSGAKTIDFKSGTNVTLTDTAGVVTFSSPSLGLGTTSGSGNAVTNIAVSGHTVTMTKGSTFLTGNQSITLSGDVTGTGSTAITTTLKNSGVTAASYTAATITVDAKGRVTSASSNTIPTVNNGTLTLAVSGTGLSGSASFTANQSGSSSFTVTSNATSVNTPSTIVSRGTSGEFSAGVISGTALNVGTGSSTWTIDDTVANVLTFKDGINTRLEIKSGGLYVNGSTTPVGSGTVTSVGATSPIASSGGSSPTISVASGYTIPTSIEKGRHDTAYTHSTTTTGSVHGSTTVGGNLLRLTNITTSDKFLRINFSDNSVSALDAATFRTAIGAGTSSTTGTVTSVKGTGTVSGITLTGTVNTTGNLTLGGSISGLTTSNLSASAGIVNAQLANSSVTVGTTAISLGGSATTIAGLTSITSTTFVGALTGTASGNLTSSSTLNASKLSGTISSAVLGNSTHYIGTTAVKLNRASATLALTGVTNTNWDSAYTATNSATSANTFSTIVKRGTSGEFSAGAVTTTALNVGTDSSTWTIDDTTTNVLTFKDGVNKRLEIKAGGLYVNGSTTPLGAGWKLIRDTQIRIPTSLTANNVTVVSGNYYGKTLAFEVRTATATDSYETHIVFARMGSNTAVTTSATYDRLYSWSTFDGRYFKTHSFKAYCSNSTTSTITVGNLKHLIGDFNGSSISWTTNTTTTTYLEKIWLVN